MSKTKLEQCLLAVYAMDEGGRIEVVTIKSLEDEDIGVVVGFEARACDGHDGEIAAGTGDTPEEAIDNLHRGMLPYVDRMLDVIDSYGREDDEPK